ncbi:hypothetical protein CRENBAI_009812 [Crenichthys baileyi]|uniref:Germ cell-specific gene 1-like protein n=1 Tax=Crenichthys baileyi TaxID=28760 RepID=A0AAV9S0S6_9TELE
MRLERGRRASLAITFNFVALAFALSAVTTSYWCEGTRKVAKPFCSGPPVKMKQSYCIRFNSSNLNDSRQVQYIFETGEEKFILRKFHTGIFFSCEQAADMNDPKVLFTTISHPPIHTLTVVSYTVEVYLAAIEATKHKTRQENQNQAEPDPDQDTE